MLFVPLVIALGIADSFAAIPSLLLVVAVTGAFLAREAASLLIRRRGPEGTAFWLAVYLVVFLIGALPLLVHYRRMALAQVGAAAVGLFLLHSLLLVWPSRRRLDRSQWGEILAVGALALTAPAAWVVAFGALDSRAWWVWAACTLFFSSGVFFVKMLLAAARMRGEFRAPERWRAGRDNLVYHALLLALVVGALWIPGGGAGILLALAYLPAILRAFRGWLRLSNVLPPLKRVGVLEVLYSLWFAGFFIVAVRALGL